MKIRRFMPMPILLLLMLSGLAAGGEVYKEVDAQGNVTYSDRPRDAAARRLDIGNNKTDPTAIAARKAALESKREERRQAQAKAAAAAESRRDLAAQRQANCKKARAYQQRVQTAHRLYDVDENGDRSYYSAEQHDAALAKARDQIREWCDTDGS